VTPVTDDVTSLTAIGGNAHHGAAFTTMRWSVVLEAQGESPAAQEALGKLCRTYWWPLYGYVRRQGHSPEEAQDNEFLKEHREVQAQQRKILEPEATTAELKSITAKQETINAQQQREIKALGATLREQASQIQKVSVQLEVEKASAQTVVNNQ
jgi:hypothetical protein